MSNSSIEDQSPWQKSTVGMLRRAYGTTIPRSDYFALIKALLPYASHRNIADLLASLDQTQRGVVYNDVLSVAAGDIEVSSFELDRVLDILRRAGYDAWLLDQDPL